MIQVFHIYLKIYLDEYTHFFEGFFSFFFAIKILQNKREKIHWKRWSENERGKSLQIEILKAICIRYNNNK